VNTVYQLVESGDGLFPELAPDSELQISSALVIDPSKVILHRGDIPQDWKGTLLGLNLYPQIWVETTYEIFHKSHTPELS
jgi:hypothetical protein